MQTAGIGQDCRQGERMPVFLRRPSSLLGTVAIVTRHVEEEARERNRPYYIRVPVISRFAHGPPLRGQAEPALRPRRRPRLRVK